MPTARSSATAISWSSPPALIVCGGRNEQSQPIAVVEVYHSRTSQWHAVTPLPFPRANMTHTVIHNVLYLVGGYEGKEATSYKKTVTVLSTAIPLLLQTSLQSSPIQWQSLSITNVSNYKPTAISLRGCLLAVGGMKELSHPPKPESVVSSVHAYCPSTSSWVLVGQLPQPLYGCITATLPTGELLVIGGTTPSGRSTDTTYKCSLSMSLQWCSTINFIIYLVCILHGVIWLLWLYRIIPMFPTDYFSSIWLFCYCLHDQLFIIRNFFYTNLVRDLKGSIP